MNNPLYWGANSMSLRRLMLIGSAGGALHPYTLTGNPIAFSTNVAKPLTKSLVAFSPVQDLHGYDNPWPAGGGKNLLDASTASSPANIVWLCEPDGFLFKANQAYTLSVPSADLLQSISIYSTDKTTQLAYAASQKSVTYTPTEDTYGLPRLYNSNGVAQTTIDKAQIELGSTATSWSPYSNLCPITGYTGVNAYRTGKNLFDVDGATVNQNKYVLDTTGELSASNYNDAVENIYVPGGTACTFSVTQETANGKIRVAQFDASGTFLHYDEAVPATGQKYAVLTITTENTCDHVSISLQKSGSGARANFATLQIELGSTATDYTPYSGNTYSVVFPALGKNLFNISKQTDYSKLTRSVVNNGDGSITVTLDANTSVGNITLREFVGGQDLVGKVCRLNATSTGSNKFIYLYGKNETWMFGNVQTITEEMLDSIVLWYASGANTSATISEVMFTVGSSAEAYEPYTNTAYAGEIDISTGQLTVSWKGVDIGSVSWTYQGAQERFFTTDFQSEIKRPVNDTVAPNAISSIYTPHALTGYGNNNFAVASSGTMFLKDSAYTSGSDLATARTGQTLVYELATPLVFQLTPQEIKSLIGDNVIWSDTNEDMTITYLKKG